MRMTRTAFTVRVALIAAGSIALTFGPALWATRFEVRARADTSFNEDAAARGWPIGVDSTWPAPNTHRVSEDAIFRRIQVFASMGPRGLITHFMAVTEYGWPAGVLNHIRIRTPDDASTFWRVAWLGTIVNLCVFLLLSSVVVLGIPAAWRWATSSLRVRRGLQRGRAYFGVIARVVLIATASIGSTFGLAFWATRLNLPPMVETYYDADAAAQGWPVPVDSSWPAPNWWGLSENAFARYFRALASDSGGMPTHHVAFDEYGWPAKVLTRFHGGDLFQDGDSISWRVAWLGTLVNLSFFSLFYVAVFLGAPAAWRRVRGARRLKRGLCPVCGYNTMDRGRCPECGWQADPV